MLPRILSDEERERLRKKYDGLHIICPKCGNYGLLNFRISRGGVSDKRYFYCKHGDKSCYVARIEDIEKVMKNNQHAKLRSSVSLATEQ